MKTNIAKAAITSAASHTVRRPPELAFTITATQPAGHRAHSNTATLSCVLDSRGNIGGASGGLFHRDTRYLSRLELLVNDGRRCCSARTCATTIPRSSST